MPVHVLVFLTLNIQTPHDGGGSLFTGWSLRREDKTDTGIAAGTYALIHHIKHNPWLDQPATIYGIQFQDFRIHPMSEMVRWGVKVTPALLAGTKRHPPNSPRLRPVLQLIPAAVLRAPCSGIPDPQQKFPHCYNFLKPRSEWAGIFRDCLSWRTDEMRDVARLEDNRDRQHAARNPPSETANDNQAAQNNATQPAPNTNRRKRRR